MTVPRPRRRSLAALAGFSLVASLFTAVAPTAALGAEESTGAVDAAGEAWQVHDLTAPTDGVLTARVTWDADADLNLYARIVNPDGSGGTMVSHSTTSADPEQLSFAATAGQQYRIYVQAVSGASDYTLLTDLSEVVEARYLGTVDTAVQTYRAHPFTLTERALVAGALDREGEAGDLGLYVRTSGGQVMDVVRTSADPERLTVDLPPGDYEWLVRAETGASAYALDTEVRAAGDITNGQARHFTAQAGYTAAGGGVQVYESHDVTVAEAGELQVVLDNFADANLDLFVAPIQDGVVGPIAASSATGTPIEQLSLPVEADSTYRLTVKATSGASGYDLTAGLNAEGLRSIVGTSDPASQNWRSYPVSIEEPGLLTGELTWDDEADLSLYLRDPDGALVEISKTDANPERISHEVAEAGDYEVLVASLSGAAPWNLDLALGTGADRHYPGHVGFNASGGGRQGFVAFDYTAVETGTATAALTWETAADLDLYVREITDPANPDSGPLLISSITKVTPEQFSFEAEAGTSYRILVGARTGAAHFDVEVGVQSDPLQRTFLGTSDVAGQRYRTYPFTTATVGDLSAALSWDDSADLSLFLRNAEGVLVAQANGSDNPELIDFEVEDAGAYSLVVASNSGAAPFTLDAVFIPGEPVAVCSPISTLPCTEVVQDAPIEFELDGTDGGLEDKDGEGVGFTMVDEPSTRLPADGEPSVPEVPGYEPELLDVTEDGLTITATQGIQYATSPPSTGTNTLINGLGVGVQPGTGVTTVTTTVVAPDFDTTASSEKGGLWYFLDEDNLFNVSVQNQAGSNVRVQFQRELNGVSTSAADEFNGAVFPEGTDVHLTLELDNEAKTATGSYQVGSGQVVTLGTFNDVPAAFFDGELLADGVTGPAAFAGVYATARNEATNEVTVTFGEFSVDTEDVPDTPNSAPEVLLTGDRTLFEGQDVVIPVSSFDEDGDDVELSVDGLPDGLAFDGDDIAGTLGQGTAEDSPYVVTVTGDDGTETASETFEITVIDDVDLSINFQPAASPVPSGYIADTGQAYGDRGDGLAFGWVAQGTETPLDMTANTRDRARAGIDPLLNTFQHMQYGDVADVYGGTANCTVNQCAKGAWEIELPNGLYEVTVAVGDQPSSSTYDSLHALNVEDGLIIREFQGTSAQEFLEATAFAGVTDGKLTVHALGGANTKIAYVKVSSVGTQPFATATIPANRATDVALDTAVSASVSVPGVGLGVDPDKDTSLTEEHVKLFEVTATGDLEVEATRGSTGGNDTIAVSPVAPLEPDTTYRFVIDGALDEAGQAFARFESTFTTGEDGSGGGEDEEFEPVEGVSFEKVLLPTASGASNGKYFASLEVHQGYLWATTIGQGMYRYEILEDGTLGPAEDLNLFKGRAAVGLIFDEDDPDLAWVTHATANIGNESAKFGSTVSVVDFSATTPVVHDVFVNLPRSNKDHLSNSLSYGPSGDGGDPWIYFLQGSNQAAGDVDGAWGRRGETQLTAAVLRFDPQDALATAIADGPIDVKTEELGGTYDPFADGAPLELYATGIRNAYDILWHSNGHIYVPTNGTAGGANSPGVQANANGTFTMVSNQLSGENGYGNGTDVTEECTTRRIDGEPYSGGSVPALSNLPTQKDFLFDVEEGGYYGHPNPTRCEWTLNDGTAYNPDIDPDSNYRGVAYDFDFNKSPNGVIEYTSETFGGALKGRMMVVRFSANDDILTFHVAADGEVLGTQAGTQIPGFTGFVDPLDLTEDTEVNPGNIYINQYNRDGQPQQLFLLRVPEDQQASTIQVTPDQGILSATLNNQRPTDTLDLTVTNAGTEAVTVTGTTTGTHAAQFSVESPVTIPAGDSTEVTVTFDPSGAVGIRTGNVVLSTGETSKTVSLRALAFAGEQGNNEPTLQMVADTFQWGITTGWSGLAGGTDPAAKGDEVLEPLFERASDGPVTMTPVAAFAPQETLPFGWYAAADGPVTINVVGTLANGQLQKLNPQLASGGTSFDPGDDAFGLFYESNTFQRIGYTEDSRNAGSTVHRARIYPLEGNRFLVAFEDADNGDYQDYVFVLDNVKAAGEEPVDPPAEGEPIKVNFQTETAPVPEGYLRDFGQAFGERTGADQGEGLSYGWLDADTLEPKGIVTNGRDRNVHADQRKDTLVHMDLPADATGGISGEVTWELEVPDGTYKVEVSVGDAQNGGSPESHTINIEGTNAIDGFPKSDAPNGSDARHEVASVTVDVTDGALTVDQAGGENTKINYVDITPLIDEEPPPAGDPIKVNFQSETAPVPDGYLRDFGQAYGARSGAGQGEGLSYGWVNQSTKAPLDMSTNGRDRNLNSDQRLDTLMHMALPEGSVGTTTPGSWEIAVEEGAYQVTVSVGDASQGTAPESHTIHVEGITAIEGFPNSAAAEGTNARHGSGTVTVEVLDGKLTLDQIGGVNTKINYVDITPVGGGASQLVAQVNFQPAASDTPAGWVADTGALFTAERGYGWVGTEGGATKTADTRERGTDSDPLNDTLIIVDDSQVAAVVDGEWEYALPSGEYTVELSVGDPLHADSVHAVTAEGVTVVDDFAPAASGDYYVGQQTVEVTDGALTLASTGHNSKLQWVRITTDSAVDIVPPQVSISLDGEGSGGTYTGPVTVTINATDRHLEFVDYTVDGGEAQHYMEPFEVTGTGSHTVEVTATDGAGNATTRSVTFVIVELGDGDITVTNPEAAPFHDRIVMSRIQNPNSNPQTNKTGKVILGNEGTEPIEVVALDIADENAFTLVDEPTLPTTIPVGGSLTVTVEFIGTGTGQNTNFESELAVRHNAADGPSTIIELGAIWQIQSEGGNEPNVVEIIEAFGVGTTIAGPGQNINNQGRLEAIGDEVLSATWKRADTSQPVTVRQLAAYHTCCSNTATFGWHPVGNKNAWTTVLTHHGSWAQSLLPRINNSSGNPALASFTPGPATWSWRIDPESSDWTLNNTGPDQCGPGNAGCQLGHHLRLWPVKDRDGEDMPGMYFAVMDYSGINYDYNDNVYLLTNVEPANPVQP